MKKILILGCGVFIGRNLAIYFSNDKSVKLYGTYLNKKPKIKNIKLSKLNLLNRSKTNRTSTRGTLPSTRQAPHASGCFTGACL